MHAGKDPREIITPEAFGVAPELLGKPLALPRQRGIAMVIDLIAISILANAGSIFLALAAAIFLFRVAKPSPEDGSMKRWLRFPLAGAAAILAFVAIVQGWGLIRSVGHREAAAPAADSVEAAAGDRVRMSLGEAGATVAEVLAFRQAKTPEATQAAAERIVTRLERAGVPRSDVRDALEGMAEMKQERWVRDAIAAALAGADSARTERELGADSLGLAWTAALKSGDSARAARLRSQLTESLAGEQMEALRDRSARLRDENRDLQKKLSRAEEGPGLLSLIRSVADELGIGFGWSGLYFTFFTALWRGRTPGKRLMGIRVLRLDGKPITWWIAFNRFGGQAASIFTGLLGFFEMFWDENRQALHDRIAWTVVVKE